MGSEDTREKLARALAHRVTDYTGWGCSIAFGLFLADTLLAVTDEQGVPEVVLRDDLEQVGTRCPECRLLFDPGYKLACDTTEPVYRRRTKEETP